jgi:prophage regulatory protein
VESNSSSSAALQKDSPLTFLRLPEVKRRVGLSRSEIYRKVKAGDFPRPVKLSAQASAWVEHEIAAWCEERLSARTDSP